MITTAPGYPERGISAAAGTTLPGAVSCHCNIPETGNNSHRQRDSSISGLMSGKNTYTIEVRASPADQFRDTQIDNFSQRLRAGLAHEQSRSHL